MTVVFFSFVLTPEGYLFVCEWLAMKLLTMTGHYIISEKETLTDNQCEYVIYDNQYLRPSQVSFVFLNIGIDKRNDIIISLNIS